MQKYVVFGIKSTYISLNFHPRGSITFIKVSFKGAVARLMTVGACVVPSAPSTLLLEPTRRHSTVAHPVSRGAARNAPRASGVYVPSHDKKQFGRYSRRQQTLTRAKSNIKLPTKAANIANNNLCIRGTRAIEGKTRRCSR